MKVQLRPNKQGQLVLFIGNKRYLIKKGLSKKKIVKFVRGKLKPNKKVVYTTYGPRSEEGASRNPQPVNVAALVNEQVERQAESMATSTEADLFRHTRDSLILMAKNAGIRNPHRMNKLTLISLLADLPKGEVARNIIEQKGSVDEKKDMQEVGEYAHISRVLGANYIPSRVRSEARRLGRDLTRGEIRNIVNEAEESMKDILDAEPDTELDRQIFQDVARGVDVESKYNLGEVKDARRAIEDAPPPRSQVDPNVYGTVPPHLRYENLRRWRPTGNGKGVDNGDALSNIQIDKIMRPYGPLYLGSCACDTIEKDILPKVKPKSKGCFIINTDREKGPGEHWTSCYFDATPGGTHEINFFDSYGDEPDPRIDKGLQAVANKLNCKNYLKFKINSVCWQGNKTGTKKESSNCGYFAVKFLIDRLRGKNFSESSGYDASKVGEHNIEKFKDGEGIHKSQIGGAFGLLPSFGPPSLRAKPGNIIETIKSAIFFPSREMSNAFKTVMRKYGNLKIVGAKIRRAPIGSMLNSMMNILSLGRFDQFRKERNFDKFFHLGIVLQLEGGKQLLLEKNAKPAFSESFTDTKDTEYMAPVNIAGQPTLNEFIQRTVDKMGKYGFTNYDALDNNCQKFILSLLEANGSLTPALKSFIYQDITGIVQRLPSYVDKISRFATDTAARAQELIGQGKRRLTTKRKQAINRLIKSFTGKM
jgi:hypothetical protein